MPIKARKFKIDETPMQLKVKATYKSMIKNAEKQTDKELIEKVQVIDRIIKRNKSIKNMLKERKSQKQIAKAEEFE